MPYIKKKKKNNSRNYFNEIVICTVGQKKKKAINFNTNHCREMKFIPFNMNYCLLQFEALNFSYESIYIAGLFLTLIFSI